MAYGNTHFLFGLTANEDVGAFKLLTVGEDDEVQLAGDGGIVIGAGPDYAVASGAECPVIPIGQIAQVEAGGTIDISSESRVASDGDGNAVAATSGDQVAGIALRDAADGDIIPVLLMNVTAPSA